MLWTWWFLDSNFSFRMLSLAHFPPFYNHFCSAKSTLILWNMKIHSTCSFIFFYLSPVLPPLPPSPKYCVKDIRVGFVTVLQNSSLEWAIRCLLEARLHILLELLSGLLTGAMESEWCLLQQHAFTSYTAPLYPESWMPLKNMAKPFLCAVCRSHWWHSKLQVNTWLAWTWIWQHSGLFLFPVAIGYLEAHPVP